MGSVRENSIQLNSGRQTPFSWSVFCQGGVRQAEFGSILGQRACFRQTSARQGWPKSAITTFHRPRSKVLKYPPSLKTAAVFWVNLSLFHFWTRRSMRRIFKTHALEMSKTVKYERVEHSHGSLMISVLCEVRPADLTSARQAATRRNSRHTPLRQASVRLADFCQADLR